MWSLFDGRDVLNEIDPRFGDNIERHIRGVLDADIFHVSANTDPKGDRSKRPQDYAGHRLTFVQFAQAPHFNHLAAVYNAFDFPDRSISSSAPPTFPIGSPTVNSKLDRQIGWFGKGRGQMNHFADLPLPKMPEGAILVPQPPGIRRNVGYNRIGSRRHVDEAET